MHSAITVSLVPQTKGGPFVFSNGLTDAAEHAARLGFDALEIFPPNADAIDRTELRALLRRHPLKVAAIGTGGGWVCHRLTLTHSDAAIRQQAHAFVRGIIDVAGEFGAPAVVGSIQGRGEGAVTREQALAQLGDALGELSGHANRHGMPLLCEPLNRYESNLCTRIGETAAWLRKLGLSNVRVLADLFHMNIEEADLAAALREAGPAIGHVHFADSNRHAVGFGHTAIAPIMAALRAIDYSGYLSAEIFPLPDPLAAAQRTIAAFRENIARP